MKYIHGGDIYRNKVKLDYSVNVNPLGMPAESLEAAKAGVDLSIHYPDSLCEELRKKLGEWEKVRADSLLFGNGAAELIYAVVHALHSRQALLVTPSFLEYERALMGTFCHINYEMLYETNNFCLTRSIIDHISQDVDLVFLCNPNNPTGQLIEQDLLVGILEKCKSCDTCLVVDECFMDFVENSEQHSMKYYLEEYKNLVILKAFTKTFGMPGLRLGYLMTYNEELRDKIFEKLPPWNISIPAQEAGKAAIRNTKYLRETAKLLKEERIYLMGELHNGLVDKIYESQANFIFFKAKKGLHEKFLEKGILIRNCSNFKGLEEGYYRIAIKKHDENEKLIVEWKQLNGGIFCEEG